MCGIWHAERHWHLAYWLCRTSVVGWMTGELSIYLASRESYEIGFGLYVVLLSSLFHYFKTHSCLQVFLFPSFIDAGVLSPFHNIMSFDPPPTSAEQTSKRPHLSIFNFSSFRQTASVEPPPYSPNDVFAERNQRLAGILHWARVILSVITLIAGAIVIGCAASSLRSYSSTHLNSQYFLPLWPTSVDLRPTHAMLACGVTISSFSLVYLISVFVPTVSAAIDGH